ncbi:hypothetical protein SORBI_3002G061732 [Sorghum bicolor]|uniref:Uncharacterized protein n=1 Tax=Sorghum bicolor TaxID=4558 RepID=A0A1W0W2K3_SORBI|nr:hypothetical protein SORBI_3002G061732 [Sorghum bicolor]
MKTVHVPLEHVLFRSKKRWKETAKIFSSNEADNHVRLHRELLPTYQRLIVLIASSSLSWHHRQEILLPCTLHASDFTSFAEDWSFLGNTDEAIGIT